MNVIEILKKATGNAPETIESLEAGVANLAASIASQERILADREANHGADLLAAKTAADGLKVEQFIQADRETLTQLRAAHGELVARLNTARDIRATQDLDNQWDACETALRARRLAFKELTVAATALGKAQLKAEQASQHAYDLLPAAVRSGSAAASYNFTRQWVDLTGPVSMMVAAASHDPSGGFTSSSVWEFAQQPTLVQQHDQAAALWLSARNAKPVLPDAA